MQAAPTLQINSLYQAPEGEGIFVGTPQIFVRFQGCAIGCRNCDSVDTWDFNAGEDWTVDTVCTRLREIGQGKIKRVSITGGDPLHPKLSPGVLTLAKELKSRGYYVHIEASGMRLVHEIFDIIDFISIDLKTPSTGVRTPLKNLKEMALHYPEKFQVKAVVENEEDFRACLRARDQLEAELNGTLNFTWCLTPAYNLGESFPRKRIQSVMDWNAEAGSPFRVIVQQHKILFGPDQKQV